MNETICVGQIRQSLKPKKQKIEGATISATGGVRYIAWDTAQHYECIQAGTHVFASEAEIQEAYTQKRIHSDMFHVYKNTRIGAERNRTVPLYEAVYAVGTYYVKVQQKHLKQGYHNASKTNKLEAWSIDTVLGVPYWVDRHVFAVMK